MNRFVSTGILTSMYRDYPAVASMAKKLSTRKTRLETWDMADPNRKMTLEESPWLQQAKGGNDGDHGLRRAQRQTQRFGQGGVGLWPRQLLAQTHLLGQRRRRRGEAAV